MDYHIKSAIEAGRGAAMDAPEGCFELGRLLGALEHLMECHKELKVGTACLHAVQLEKFFTPFRWSHYQAGSAPTLDDLIGGLNTATNDAFIAGDMSRTRALRDFLERFKWVRGHALSRMITSSWTPACGATVELRATGELVGQVVEIALPLAPEDRVVVVWSPDNHVGDFAMEDLCTRVQYIFCERFEINDAVDAYPDGMGYIISPPPPGGLVWHSQANVRMIHPTQGSVWVPLPKLRKRATIPENL